MFARSDLSTARAKMSKVAAVAGLSEFLIDENRFVTAVLAATGRKRLNCGSSAVAGGISYCCRPAVQEIGVRGGEHSSGRHRVSVNSRRFEATAATLDITPTAVDLSVPTHTCWCLRVSSSDIRSKTALSPKHEIF